MVVAGPADRYYVEQEVNYKGLETLRMGGNIRDADVLVSISHAKGHNCVGYGAAGIDGGLTEMWMGHVFALDSAYLRMSDEQLEAEYLKAVDRFTFLGQTNGTLKSRMEQLEEENKDLKARLDRLEAISVERLILATKERRRSSPPQRLSKANVGKTKR